VGKQSRRRREQHAAKAPPKMPHDNLEFRIGDEPPIHVHTRGNDETGDGKSWQTAFKTVARAFQEKASR
jgi:hypothetical protein